MAAQLAVYVALIGLSYLKLVFELLHCSLNEEQVLQCSSVEPPSDEATEGQNAQLIIQGKGKLK